MYKWKLLVHLMAVAVYTGFDVTARELLYPVISERSV